LVACLFLDESVPVRNALAFRAVLPENDEPEVRVEFGRAA
jgi:hypothetical protein